MTKVEHSVEYQAYIASDDWRTRRQPILDRAQGCCERCRQPALWLEVHHLTYERLGRERDSDLQALCSACHATADRERVQRVQAEIAHSRWDARVDAWATKRYGEDWADDHDEDEVEEEFEEWLERRGDGY